MDAAGVFTGISAVIYDLDGTLYADTHHFAFYAQALADQLPAERRADFQADWQLAERGQHPLRIGRLYDAERDLILTARAGAVVAACRWDGAVLPADTVRSLYPGPVAIDHMAVMNVGDLWWVPAAIASHHGLGASACRQAFLATRAFMSQPDFTLRPIPGLGGMMRRWRAGGILQVLATNSPEPDSRILVAKAGLSDAIDLWFFETGKPTGLARVVAAVRDRLGGVATASVVSIGDNYLNDIAPARALGCRTVLLDSHPDPDSEARSDLQMRDMAELVDLIRKLRAG